MNEQELYNLWMQEQRDGNTMPFDQWKLENGYSAGVGTAENPFLPSTTTPTNPLTSAIDSGLQAGVNRASAGGNTDQIQGGFQSGAFETSGQTQQSQTSGQAVTGAQTNNEATALNSQQVSGANQVTQGSQQQTTANTGTQSNTGTSVEATKSGTSGTTSSTGLESTAGSQQTTGQQATFGQQQNSGFSNLINSLVSSGMSTTQAQTLMNALQQQQSSQQQSGQQNVTGERTVTDPYGFGALLSSQAGGATQQDAARTAFLQDVMNTGGTGFNEQVQAAINSSLSGPGMQGVGTMAQGRVAGSAASDIARNNLGQRLQASDQLRQPGQVQSLVSAGIPFLGERTAQQSQASQMGTQQSTEQSQQQELANTIAAQQQQQSQNQAQQTGSLGQTLENTTNQQNMTNQQKTSSLQDTANRQTTSGVTSGQTSDLSKFSNVGATAGTTTGATSSTGYNNTAQQGTTAGSTTNNQNTVGFADLLSNETQSGTSDAASRQVATGKIPEGTQTQSGGGGCVVCTAYVDLGLMNPGAIRRGVEFKLRNFPRYRSSIRAYMAYGPLIARLVLASQTFRRWFRPIARAILYEECRLAAPRRLPKRLGATLCHWVFDVPMRPLGWFASGRVKDAKILEVLNRNNLMFNWEDAK